MNKSEKIKQLIKLDTGLYFGEVLGAGMRHGMGIMLSRDDSFYKGEWVYDKKEGYGYERNNCYEYFGGFFRGSREGFGIFWNFEKKTIYNGQWSKGKQHGKGKINYQNGSEFKGMWVNGKRYGFGSTIKKDVMYSGIYKNGVKHGMFCFNKVKNGQTFRVQYLQGKECAIETKKGFKTLKSEILIEIKKQKMNKLKIKKRSRTKSKIVQKNFTNHFNSPFQLKQKLSADNYSNEYENSVSFGFPRHINEDISLQKNIRKSLIAEEKDLHDNFEMYQNQSQLNKIMKFIHRTQQKIECLNSTCESY